MSSQPNLPPRYFFGPFEYDAASGELKKHRSRVRIQGQPQMILSSLLVYAGDVVSRETLQRELWSSATSGDFEHGLNAAVNKLRQILGDSAEQPRYIETLPGRGYRFIAPLNSPPLKSVVEMSPAPHVLPNPVSRVEPLKVAAALLALIAAGGLGYWLAPRAASPAASKPTQFAIHPPAGYFLEGAGIRQSFALSPDGSRIAFTALDSSGSFRAFIRELSSLEAKPVPDGEGGFSLFWSPDSRSLLFTARGQLRRMSLSGAATQTLGKAMPYLDGGIPLGKETLLLSSHMFSATISASGSALKEVPAAYPWPQLLPDGQHFLYTLFDRKLGQHRARVSRVDPLGEGQEVVIADSRVMYAGSAHHPGGYLLYLRAGTLLAQPFDVQKLKTTGEPMAIVRRVTSFSHTGAADFSVSDRGTLAYQTFANRSQLEWVDRTGRHLATATPPDLSTKFARVSPDGKKIATSVYDVDSGSANIWIFEGGTGRRLSVGPGTRHGPMWSPDGKKLAFFRAWGSVPRLFLQSIEAGSPEEALPESGFMLGTSWSPDGRFILYNNSGLPAVGSDEQSDIFAIDLARGRKIVPLVQTPFHEANAATSPDGRWVAFTSNESGRTEIYLQHLEIGETIRVTGPRHLISRNGAQCLRWRSDGKEIYYLGFDSRIYAVPLQLTPAIEAGVPKELFSISTEARAAIHTLLGFDVSPDGSRFIIPSVTSKEGPALVVVQDWEAALLPHASKPRTE